MSSNASPTPQPAPTSRDAALLALRPTVSAEPPSPVSDPSVGAFLHSTLRPVLKLQNALLLAAVADFVADHHMPFVKAAPADQQRMLTELLGRNTKLRYTVLGLVTGHFTAEERAFYGQHRAELNRRLLDLALHRTVSQTPIIAELVSGA